MSSTFPSPALPGSGSTGLQRSSAGLSAGVCSPTSIWKGRPVGSPNQSQKLGGTAPIVQGFLTCTARGKRLNWSAQAATKPFSNGNNVFVTDEPAEVLSVRLTGLDHDGPWSAGLPSRLVPEKRAPARSLADGLWPGDG